MEHIYQVFDLEGLYLSEILNEEIRAGISPAVSRQSKFVLEPHTQVSACLTALIRIQFHISGMTHVV